MQINYTNIESFINDATSHLIIDVRSPAEYLQGHIPGAKNLPILNNEERAAVGTCYKKIGKQAAVKLGFELFGPKMASYINELERILKSEKINPEQNIFVYCWRGGKRSYTIAWLLQMNGYKVTVLDSGYKTFRTWVLEYFKTNFNFQVIGGYTGSAKTKLLHLLKNNFNQNIIDLEQIAHHKGSSFGGYNQLPQPSQEHFENILFMQLYQIKNKNTPIWIEDESRRIGNLQIPEGVWLQLRTSKLFFLEIDFNTRLQNIIEEYGAIPTNQLIEATLRINKKLGGLETQLITDALTNQNIALAFEKLLLYYDKVYTQGTLTRNPENVCHLTLEGFMQQFA